MEKLIADQLQEDPRVAEANRLLQEAVREVGEQITGIRPPQAKLQESYEKLLHEMARCRASDLFYPYLGSGIGRGALVELADGSVKYDFISGIGAHFGHSLPSLLNAQFRAAASDLVMQGNLQQNRESLLLMQRLITASGLDHCFLSTSGAMANVNGLKLAFYHKQPRSRVLAFEHCFMGRTITLSQITDKPADRRGLPMNLFVDYIPFYDPKRPEESTEAALQALRDHLKRHPSQHAVMAFELVQGEGGFRVGSHDFFRTLMEELRKNDVAILIDEVQTFGRTTELFAYQHFGLEEFAEIVCFGKLAQVCGTLYTQKYVPPRVLLSQTFTSSTSAIFSSLAILEQLQEGHFGGEGRNAKLHAHFQGRLEEIRQRHPNWIAGPYGVGGMVAFTPLDGQRETVLKLLHTLFANGVIGFLCGHDPARIRFLLPLGGVTMEDIDKTSEVIEKSLGEVACS